MFCITFFPFPFCLGCMGHSACHQTSDLSQAIDKRLRRERNGRRGGGTSGLCLRVPEEVRNGGTHHSPAAACVLRERERENNRGGLVGCIGSGDVLPTLTMYTTAIERHISTGMSSRMDAKGGRLLPPLSFSHTAGRPVAWTGARGAPRGSTAGHLLGCGKRGKRC